MLGLVHSRSKNGVASLAYGIHVLAAPAGTKNVDGRDKPGHDDETLTAALHPTSHKNLQVIDISRTAV